LRALVPDPDDIATVELEVNPFTLTAMGLAEPGPGLEGKFSVHHATAVGYLVGRAGPDEFIDARVLDPAVISLRRRLRFTPIERIPRDAVDVVATTRDGAVHRFSIEHATGSVDRPMTDAQLRAKATAEIARTLSTDAAHALAERLFADGDGPVRDVVALATP
jgi:2-methylcitrate dehydratase PrpD